MGPVTAVGVVGADRVPAKDLTAVFRKHGAQHAHDRDLYEKAVVAAAKRLGVAVTILPATGKLFTTASQSLGVDVEASLTALGKTIGPPWQKPHREAATVALVALATAE